MLLRQIIFVQIYIPIRIRTRLLRLLTAQSKAAIWPVLELPSSLVCIECHAREILKGETFFKKRRFYGLFFQGRIRMSTGLGFSFISCDRPLQPFSLFNLGHHVQEYLKKCLRHRRGIKSTLLCDDWRKQTSSLKATF